MAPPRRLRESHKRIVAARQGWRCSACDVILSSAFQVDHTIPLWRGGADEISNTNALCASCHAIKTQLEGIERADKADKARRLEVQKAQAEFEKTVRAEELAKQGTSKRKAGQSECTLCNARFFPLFEHRCRVVEQKIQERLNPPRKKPRLIDVIKADDNPFLRFAFV
jgi:hypothetical protein